MIVGVRGSLVGAASSGGGAGGSSASAAAAAARVAASTATVMRVASPASGGSSSSSLGSGEDGSLTAAAGSSAVQKLAHRREALVGGARHAAEEHLVDRLRHAGDERRHVREHAARHVGDGAGAVEGHLAGEHLVGDDGERVLVDARVEHAAEELLGRHVRHGADDGVDGGELGRAADLGHAEVDDLDVAVAAQDDVLRLQIAMDDVPGVRHVERGGDVADDAQRLVERQLAHGAPGARPGARRRGTRARCRASRRR